MGESVPAARVFDDSSDRVYIPYIAAMYRELVDVSSASVEFMPELHEPTVLRVSHSEKCGSKYPGHELRRRRCGLPEGKKFDSPETSMNVWRVRTVCMVTWRAVRFENLYCLEKKFHDHARSACLLQQARMTSFFTWSLLQRLTLLA
jgi:hypothetical protein